jgi:hypothetical protein
MNSVPVICFGQQPCGFFPKRFFVAKVMTARQLQSEIGGEIVCFYHDSDHDPRETKTTVRHPVTDDAFAANFEYGNKTIHKYTPLYRKPVLKQWHHKAADQLRGYVAPELMEMFKSTSESWVADFCLSMYRKTGLLDGIRVVRSSDPEFRKQACDIADYYVDTTWEGELVRARVRGDGLVLHKGGEVYVSLPKTVYCKQDISPTRDSRLRWMQSVLHCTHYVSGASEQNYMHMEETPEIEFVKRFAIDRADEAYTELEG